MSRDRPRPPTPDAPRATAAERRRAERLRSVYGVYWSLTAPEQKAIDEEALNYAWSVVEGKCLEDPMSPGERDCEIAREKVRQFEVIMHRQHESMIEERAHLFPGAPPGKKTFDLMAEQVAQGTAVQ